MILFIIAMILLILGHYFKILRWKQFINIYEQSSKGMLLRALGTGYVVNYIVPYRIGDLVRAVLSGRKLKNGISFSIATILVDHCLDVPVICLIFLVMHFALISNNAIYSSFIFYILLMLGLIILGFFLLSFKNTVKKITKTICAIFNSHIEFHLLFFLWGCITAFKDIFQKINKGKLFLYSICMWLFYLSSYFCVTEYAIQIGFKFRFSDLFVLLFSGGSIQTAMITSGYQMSNGSSEFSILIAGYILIPLIIILIMSFLRNNMKMQVLHLRTDILEEPQIINLLPQVNEKDKLNFLEAYFSGNHREYLQKYLELNRDIHILQDFSAGSNATTMLCMDGEKTFYRKYAFEKDGDKLYEQLRWLHEHEKDLLLPEIIKEQYGDGYCCYDMTYNAAAVGMFSYLHSVPLAQSWSVLQEALNDLHQNLHTKNSRPSDLETVQKYIKAKVWENVKKIETSHEIRPLLAYDSLIINGKEYKNLNRLKKWLEIELLVEIFKDDMYTDIHGDLTIENIVCWEGNVKPPYYFIDPNGGNLHDSPALDYAKLLQSLHGGYEFLMRTEKVEVKGNQVNFLSTCSKNYTDIFQCYRNYLERKFSREHVRSIFFHEVVHWLRLMPYKIEKNGKRAVLFYAEFIKVFNEVVDWYGGEL